MKGKLWPLVSFHLHWSQSGGSGGEAAWTGALKVPLPRVTALNLVWCGGDALMYLGRETFLFFERI